MKLFVVKTVPGAPLWVSFLVLTTNQGILKGGCITVLLTSCFTGLDWSVLQIKTKIVSCHTADSKPVKQEVNSTVIPPPLVFPATNITLDWKVWPGTNTLAY
jgi:hypothetical protein